MKSHTCFQLVPTSLTLNHLERCNSPYFELFHRIRYLCRQIASQCWRQTYDIRKKYRLPVTFGQNWSTQQSHGLFATAKLRVASVIVVYIGVVCLLQLLFAVFVFWLFLGFYCSVSIFYSHQSVFVIKFVTISACTVYVRTKQYIGVQCR